MPVYNEPSMMAMPESGKQDLRNEKTAKEQKGQTSLWLTTW